MIAILTIRVTMAADFPRIFVLSSGWSPLATNVTLIS